MGLKKEKLISNSLRVLTNKISFSAPFFFKHMEYIHKDWINVETGQ